MRTCRCACGSTITLPDLMETWDVPMLAHVRGIAHQAWRQTTPPHLYEEHLDTLLAGAATSDRRGPTSASTSGR